MLPVGSTQALDHRRMVRRLELNRRLADPLFLWPVVAALVQGLGL